jgi:hypothetical protein
MVRVKRTHREMRYNITFSSRVVQSIAKYHTFNAATPSSYVWIPSEVLHVRH